jgi:hypothetical protein
MPFIEQNGREWIVVEAGRRVSLHPTKEEAERAIDWLVTQQHVNVAAPECTDVPTTA